MTQERLRLDWSTSAALRPAARWSSSRDLSAEKMLLLERCSFLCACAPLPVVVNLNANNTTQHPHSAAPLKVQHIHTIQGANNQDGRANGAMVRQVRAGIRKHTRWIKNGHQTYLNVRKTAKQQSSTMDVSDVESRKG